MSQNSKIIKADDVVIKFAGDSGDGMQLTGHQFSDTSATGGNVISTFPDYPSEIRAPQGTVAGVSGFTVHIGHKEVFTPGDQADVLVAMNPAALKANMPWIKRGATIIVDDDNFDEKNLAKAKYDEDPFKDSSLVGYNVVHAPISTLTRKSLEGMDLDNKTILRSKNMFALGMVYWLFNKELVFTEDFLKSKFKKKPILVEANTKVLKAGYNFAYTKEELNITYQVLPIKNKKGRFRNITGNIATAWGLIAAAEKAGLKLFLGSYPITPASEILQELSNRKDLGVIAFQAEDEIAGITSAIGASFAGCLAATSTSGPGLSLKSEAIGLAIITELPLVIVNVQRGGPSTGLPTKTEQSDLMQALYGRNGEAPCVVMCATTSSNCFQYAYKAAKLALEHMVPVILLTDGYLANGSELMEIPKVAKMEDIKPRLVKDNDPDYYPYKRDPETLARSWAVPGQMGLRHRIGGLEKDDIYGNVSQDPANHQRMTELRAAKVDKVKNYIPRQQVKGSSEGDLLVIGWGGTFGALFTAVSELREEGHNVSLAQFNYINPLPVNTEEVLSNFKKRLVCELNMGQFVSYLRMNFPDLSFQQFNKVQGLPFLISELKEKILEELANIK